MAYKRTTYTNSKGEIVRELFYGKKNWGCVEVFKGSSKGFYVINYGGEKECSIPVKDMMSAIALCDILVNLSTI